jgi:hypothetical protein
VRDEEVRGGFFCCFVCTGAMHWTVLEGDVTLGCRVCIWCVLVGIWKV